MKKLVILLAVCFFGYSCAHSNEDLFQAIKKFDVDGVKSILADKSRIFDKSELTKHLDDLKRLITQPQSYTNLPWYERYGSLAKIALGATGLILTETYLFKKLFVKIQVTHLPAIN